MRNNDLNQTEVYMLIEKIASIRRKFINRRFLFSLLKLDRLTSAMKYRLSRAVRGRKPGLMSTGRFYSVGITAVIIVFLISAVGGIYAFYPSEDSMDDRL